MGEITSIKIEQPAVVLVFPYEGEPYGVFTPDDSYLPMVLDWVARAYPEHLGMIEQFVAAVKDSDEPNDNEAM